MSESQTGSRDNNQNNIKSDIISTPPDREDSAVHHYEKALQEEKEKRMEERFYWVLAFVLYADILFFTQINHWSPPIVIGILQIFGLVVYADRCKVGTVRSLFDQMTSSFKKGLGEKD